MHFSWDVVKYIGTISTYRHVMRIVRTKLGFKYKGRGFSSAFLFVRVHEMRAAP
jgi:hypothetical protein